MSSMVSAAASGFALSASLIAAIGAQNMFVLRQGLRREHVGAIVLFCSLADAVLIAAGVAGLGAVVSLRPGLTTGLAVAGGVFLTGYGLLAFRRAASTGGLVAAEAQALTLTGAMARTAAFTFLNPHVYLDTVLLMGSAGSTQAPALRPVFVAGGSAASVLWFAGLGYGARLLQPLLIRPGAWRVIDCLVGATMLLLAFSLVSRLF